MFRLASYTQKLSSMTESNYRFATALPLLRHRFAIATLPAQSIGLIRLLLSMTVHILDLVTVHILDLVTVHILDLVTVHILD